MKLKELLKGVSFELQKGSIDIDVSDVAFDSRNAQRGYVFVAVEGYKSKGSSFIKDALSRGAYAIISETAAPKDLPASVSYVKVGDARIALSKISKNFYNDPSGGMKVVGVTGTNGKTTVTYLLESIFARAGIKSCVLGTISHRGPGFEVDAQRTTPESLEIQQFLSRMKKDGVSHVAMECSSHAVELKRLEDISYDICIFTNITQDHLDFHLTMEKYREAKKALFSRILANSKKPDRSAIVNLDDRFAGEIAASTDSRVVTYGFSKDADTRPVTFDLSQSSTKAEIATPFGTLSIRSPLVGDHNLGNIMAAASAALALGISCDHVMEGVAALRFVPGRLHKVENERGLNIYVDYAHTDDALNNVLRTLGKIRKGRIITVFGCGGDRDRGKRPKMGKVASELSDITIITSDNPRSEDPAEIIGDIVKGVDTGSVRKINGSMRVARGQRSYAVVCDRKKALRMALELAEEGDSILVAGKGHEEYQEFSSGRVHFSDREYMESLLKDKSTQ